MWCLARLLPLMIGELIPEDDEHWKLYITFLTIVTWFAKTHNNPAKTKIQIMAWHESHTPALSRHTNGRAINSQVCSHRHHFCDPVNSWQSSMECVVPLGRNDKATLGIKMPSATVPAWQVNCGCLCTSMNTQWLLFC